MKWKVGVLCGILCIVTVGSVFRYQKINAAYPSAIEKEYQQGELVPCGKFQLSVEGTKLYTPEEMLKVYQIPILEEDKKYGEAIYLLADVKVKNTSEKKEKFQYGDISSQCKNGSTIYDLEKIFDVNEEIIKEYAPGQEAVTTIPFKLTQRGYSTVHWEHIRTLEKMIVFSVYPEKKYVVAVN